MAIDKELKILSEKLQKKLKRQDSNFSFSLSQIRDEINKVSTDYANIGTEQETLIMDNLINKSQSSIDIKSHCDLNSTEDNATANESNTNNNQGENNMKDANANNQSSLTVNNQQSNAITFNDDLDKAIEIRKIAQNQSIELNTKQCLEIAEKTENQFQSNEQFRLEVLEYLGIEISKRANQSINKCNEKIEEIKEMQISYQNREELLMQMGINEMAERESESLKRMKNILKDVFTPKIVKSE